MTKSNDQGKNHKQIKSIINDLNETSSLPGSTDLLLSGRGATGGNCKTNAVGGEEAIHEAIIMAVLDDREIFEKKV